MSSNCTLVELKLDNVAGDHINFDASSNCTLVELKQ